MFFIEGDPTILTVIDTGSSLFRHFWYCNLIYVQVQARTSQGCVRASKCPFWQTQTFAPKPSKWPRLNIPLRIAYFQWISGTFRSGSFNFASSIWFCNFCCSASKMTLRSASCPFTPHPTGLPNGKFDRNLSATVVRFCSPYLPSSSSMSSVRTRALRFLSGNLTPGPELWS